MLYFLYSLTFNVFLFFIFLVRNDFGYLLVVYVMERKFQQQVVAWDERNEKIRRQNVFLFCLNLINWRNLVFLKC